MSDPVPAGGTPSSNRTVMIILSYLWILALIPLLVEKDDREVQWHAKHGIVLLVAELVLGVTLGIVNSVVASVPFFGCLAAFIGALVGFVIWIAVIVVHVLAIVKGVNGQRFLVPYVSEYANRL
ncbi:MAG: hypothetical protein EHM24_05390 [Acidobacteria bacterium]|nr:MAG: hypothetical protein EHM24_05390 [Acidobacteriota bacterium]